jgi:lipopolysaccharide/colanic/teichoic acid biosynthesis glycosyltransferase
MEFGLLYFTFGFGWQYLTKLLTLGVVETHKQNRVTVYGDNSFLILLYGILALVAVIALIYLWRLNLKQNREAEQLLARGKRLPSNGADFGSLFDKNFDKTLLALPVLGIFVFTVVPIIFMICIAFTNYDANHQPPAKLFSWVGLNNFKELFGIGGSGNFGGTFFYVLGWTLTWAVTATLSCYIGGMLLAMLINHRRTRWKPFFRTCFIAAMAVPQFVSLLLMRNQGLFIDQQIAKRIFDVICSLLLILLTSPIMLVIAIAINCCDRGPVFFKQARLTQNGKVFQVYKFRSMYIRPQDPEYCLTRKKDPRITPVGAIIRRLHLDELPQLFNILKGDMSFVGPRPECPAIADEYAQVVPEFKYRLKVKGGLTGYAQVYGKYNTTPYDKLKLDLTYIENYSFLLDLKLIALTFKVMFHPDNTEGIESWQTTAAVPQPEADKEGVEV